MQRSRGTPLYAASTLESMQRADFDSEVSEEEANELARQESHQHASSSNGVGFYEGAGPGTSEIASEPVDALAAEINACDETDDITEIVGDEAEVMSGTSLAAALKRCS